ncbi:LysR substrate-binding domain-containing protein [Pseudomonas sp. NPDC096950]|uniref:LysR substrate-binding domain-containing protein n=1 Tax=Pseudomonas sp. NPDC096950 TaxID=3364485 RepID=UPI00383A4D55
MEDQLNALLGLQTGEIRIVLSQGCVDTLMESVLTDFCRTYPEQRVLLDVLPVDEVLAEVAQNRAHIGLAYNPGAHPDIEYRLSEPQPVELLVNQASAGAAWNASGSQGAAGLLVSRLL